MIPESWPRNSFLASSGSSGSNRMAVSYLFGVILRSCLLSADRAPGRFAGSKEYVTRRGFRGGLVGRIAPRGGPSDSHADPQEIGGPEAFPEGAQPVVAARAPAPLQPHRARRQVEVVVDDHEVSGAVGVLPVERGHRVAGQVHERRRLGEDAPPPLDLAGPPESISGRAPPRSPRLGDQLDSPKPRVVERRG